MSYIGLNTLTHFISVKQEVESVKEFLDDGEQETEETKDNLLNLY